MAETCVCCGATEGLGWNMLMKALVCPDCIFVWYDQGIVDREQLKAASLKRQQIRESIPQPSATALQESRGEARAALISAGWAYLHAIADGSVCNNRSCYRCRLADLILETEVQKDDE